MLLFSKRTQTSHISQVPEVENIFFIFLPRLLK